MKVFYFSILLFLTGSGAVAQNALLWEISGNGLRQPSYLYGTMHLLCKNAMPKHDSALLALSHCNRLVIEMDESKVGLLKQLRLVRMQGDSNLGHFFNEMELGEIAGFFADSLGLRLSLFMNMKPALLSSLVILHALPCEKEEMTGMEKMLKEKADSLHIRLDELESFSYQAALFDSIPYAVQARELLDGVRRYPELKEEFLTLLHLYSGQKLDSIALLAGLDDMLAYDMEGRFITGRNLNWLKKMPGFMQKYPCFFAVGAAHLPGENGLIALLRQEGYTLRPVFEIPR